MKSLNKPLPDRIVTHENLIESTCAYIHILADGNPTGTLDETSRGVLELLSCLENIICHSIKDAAKFRKDWRVWHWIAEACSAIPQSCVPLVKSMDNLQHGLAKLRALLRLALQSKGLHLYLDRSFNFVELIKKHYHPNTILLSNEIRRVTNAASELQYLDFCFDIRADELNFSSLRQVDYALIIEMIHGRTLSSYLDATTATVSQGDICKQCEDLTFKARVTNSQKKYLEDVVRDTNRQLIVYKENETRLSHDNNVLRTALDQLQTKFVLLHEEYSQRLQRLGVSLTNPGLLSPLPRSTLDGPQSFRPRDVVAHEATEDLTVVFGRGVSLLPICGALDITAREATEDIDPVDLLLSPPPLTPTHPVPTAFTPRGGSVRPTSLRVECPALPTTSPSVRGGASRHSNTSLFAVAEQEVDEDLVKYRLPNAVDTSPDPTALTFDLKRWVVTVKPTDTNYRARFSLPKTAPTNASTHQPQLDLLSELQQTDSSFPITGLTNSSDCLAADSSSGQVSEFALDMTSEVVDEVCREENAATKAPAITTSTSSRNTVLTSTSTIKPVTSCISLSSPLSNNNEAEATKVPPIRGLYRWVSQRSLTKSHFYTLADSPRIDSAPSGGNSSDAETCWKHQLPRTPLSTSSPRRKGCPCESAQQSSPVMRLDQSSSA